MTPDQPISQHAPTAWRSLFRSRARDASISRAALRELRDHPLQTLALVVAAGLMAGIALARRAGVAPGGSRRDDTLGPSR